MQTPGRTVERETPLFADEPKEMTEDQSYMRSNQLLNTLQKYLFVPAEKRPVKIIEGITRQLSKLMGIELTPDDAMQMAEMTAYQSGSLDARREGQDTARANAVLGLAKVLIPMLVNRGLSEGQAMDKVNADAFEEAYKDLLNLANVAMGGGEPVR